MMLVIKYNKGGIAGKHVVLPEVEWYTFTIDYEENSILLYRFIGEKKLNWAPIVDMCYFEEV